MVSGYDKQPDEERGAEHPLNRQPGYALTLMLIFALMLLNGLGWLLF